MIATADGRPIQPLHTGHIARYADNSRGIRRVSRGSRSGGVEHDMLDVLRDSALARLLSDDGPLREPRYRTRDTLRHPPVARADTTWWRVVGV